MRAITDHSPHLEEAPALTLPRAEGLMGAVSKGEDMHSALRPSFETAAKSAFTRVCDALWRPPQDEVE
jgi:hypothetical protein